MSEEKIPPNPPEEESKPKPKKSKLKSCCDLLYNSQTGEVLGRNGGSWLRIFIFYVVFFSFLFAFFFAFIFILLLNLDVVHPRHKGTDNGLISSSPGMTFTPSPAQKDSGFVFIDLAVNNSILIEDMSKFLEINNKRQKARAIQECTWDLGATVKCHSNIDTGKCTNEVSYGYNTGQPCFVVRLNKIIDWKPVSIFKSKTAADLEKELKEDEKKFSVLTPELRNYIKENAGKLQSENETKRFLETVWIQCEGDQARDREQMGAIAYYPMPGIPSYFYPFERGTETYMVPFVMIQFLNPLPNVPISMNCKAISANIEGDVKMGIGGVRFQFLLKLAKK